MNMQINRLAYRSKVNNITRETTHNIISMLSISNKSVSLSDNEYIPSFTPTDKKGFTEQFLENAR